MRTLGIIAFVVGIILLISSLMAEPVGIAGIIIAAFLIIIGIFMTLKQPKPQEEVAPEPEQVPPAPEAEEPPPSEETAESSEPEETENEEE